jgi:predicted Zn-dependent peptidase
MKKRILLVLLSFILLALFFYPGVEIEKHPRDMVFESVKFSPPRGERVVLKNGMVLYILEDHELPLLSLSAIIRAGSIYDPPDKSGLAELAGKVMRSGGTTSLSAEQINDRLEYVGGSVEVGIGRESGSATLSVLKKDINTGIKIFADILTNPRFDPEKLDLAKKQKIETIRRENDDPENIAFREFKRILYKDNPRGRTPSISSIRKIGRQDLIAFHNRFFNPENIILAISGDFHKEEIVRKLEEILGEWSKVKRPLPEVAPPGYSSVRSVSHAYKEAPQSVIVIGHLTVRKTDPDYFPFKVLNFILGEGGFNSRLISEIRSNRGLAYTVGSFYRAEPDYGAFAAICLTRSETTCQAISLIYQIIKEIKKNGVTEEELKWAKESLINKFIFTFDSSAGIVNWQMNLEYDGLCSDFLEKYPDNISKVTREDIRRVAVSYLHPEESVLMVVGNDKSFDRPLTDFGKVNRIERN